MKIISYVLMFFVLLLGLTFACLNAESVDINYYFGVTHLPLSLLVGISFAAGGLLGLFAGFITYLKQKRQQYRLSNRIKTVEKELENLRSIPLQDNY